MGLPHRCTLTAIIALGLNTAACQNNAQAPQPPALAPDAGIGPDSHDATPPPDTVGDTADDTVDQDATTPDVPAACPDDEACPDGQICLEGSCVEGCRFDGACPEGQICQASLCTDGCRNPADCPAGTTCQNLTCVQVGCASDQECGNGHQCQDQDCVEIGDADCDNDLACGFRWRCSALGICHEGACLVHEDCEPDQWCRQNICQTRNQELGAVSLERIYPTPVAERRTHESLVYGAGGGFFDANGDLKLDLFLGAWDPARDSPPCAYHNTSEPGTVSFSPIDGLCSFEALGQVLAAGGIDVDNDGRDELLLLGPGIVRLERFHPTRQSTDLLDTLPLEDTRRTCFAGSHLPVDLNFDGRVDLVVGCQSRKVPNASTQTNLIFIQDEHGQLIPNAITDDPLESNGVTLALGALDINEDGLLDVVVINDTFVANAEATNTLTTGAALLRCTPLENCDWRPRFLGRDNARWGSFMGVGNVRVHNQGEHLYITDWGANRLLRDLDNEDGPLDAALDFGAALALSDGTLLFAWSAVVDDFDRNGLDDIFVSQGMSISADLPSYATHRDVILFQRADGTFETLDEAIGLEPHTHEDSGDPQRVSSSRGAAKADLDQDGHLDLVITVLEGRPRFYSERPTEDNAADRCTLIPKNRLVPSYGHGYAIFNTEHTDRQRMDVQGHMRFGASPWLLTTHNQGIVRFPSGAQVAYDCQGEPGPVVIEEPDWLQIERDGLTVQLTLDTPWLEDTPQIQAAFRNSQNSTRMLDATPNGDGWTFSLQPDDTALMLNINGRWLARWFPLP